MTEERELSDAIEHGHVRAELRARPLVIFLGILVLVLVVVYGITRWLLHGIKSALPPSQIPRSLVESREQFPAPQLEVSRTQNIDQLRARENTLLNSYQWVDQTKGIARIPIDEAMRLVAEKKAALKEGARSQEKAVPNEKAAPKEKATAKEKDSSSKEAKQ